MEEHLSWRQLRARAIPRSAILKMDVTFKQDGSPFIEYTHQAGTPGTKPYMGTIEEREGKLVYTCTCPDAQERKGGEFCKHAHHAYAEYLEPSMAIPISIGVPVSGVRVPA